VVLSYNTLILTGVRPVNPTLVLGIGRSYDQGPHSNFIKLMDLISCRMLGDKSMYHAGS